MTDRLLPATVAAAAPGALLGATGARAVEQDTIDRFAVITGDLQWIHTDPVRAAAGRYGGTVLHGYLILALLPTLTREVIDFGGSGSAVLNYGLERVRFVAPIRVGTPVVDTIRLGSVRDRAEGQLFELEHTISSAEHSEVHCVARTLTLLTR